MENADLDGLFRGGGDGKHEDSEGHDWPEETHDSFAHGSPFGSVWWKGERCELKRRACQAWRGSGGRMRCRFHGLGGRRRARARLTCLVRRQVLPADRAPGASESVRRFHCAVSRVPSSWYTISERRT